MNSSLSNEAGCCAEMDYSSSSWCYCSEDMYVRHYIVPPLFLLFSGSFELVRIQVLFDERSHLIR